MMGELLLSFEHLECQYNSSCLREGHHEIFFLFLANSFGVFPECLRHAGSGDGRPTNQNTNRPSIACAAIRCATPANIHPGFAYGHGHAYSYSRCRSHEHANRDAIQHAD